MIRTVLRRLLDELAEVRGLVGDVERRLDRIELVSIVREPSTNAAADAYEGLRRQVVAAASSRMAHLAQVVEFDLALARGADRAVLGSLVEGWFAQAGVQRIADPGHADADLLFELVGDRGGALMVLEPAYRDSVTGRIVRQGRALRQEVSRAHAGPTPREPAGAPAVGDDVDLYAHDGGARASAADPDGTTLTAGTPGRHAPHTSPVTEGEAGR